MLMYTNIYLYIIIILIIIFFWINKKNYENFVDKKDDYFKDKVVIITGSTNGIGFSLAKLMSKLPCKLVIHGKSQNSVDTALKKLSKNKKKKDILGVVADLSDEKNFDLIYENTIDKFDRIDILVNNIVSQQGSTKLMGKSYKDWKNEINVNVNSIFYLTQKVIEYMKSKGIKGKIVSISSNDSKQRDTQTNSGSTILSKSFLERMNELIASEIEKDDICIGVIRIDSGNYKTRNNNLMDNTFLKDTFKKINAFTSMLYDNPDDLVEMFVNIIKLPHHQLNGRVYSTSAFKENPELSKIVPSYQLLINKNLYKEYKHTKTKKPDEIFIAKQNPYGMSKVLQDFIKSYDFNKSMFNVNTKSKSELKKYIAKKLLLKTNNITFFRNELEALKKILITFVSKYGNVFSLYPNNDKIELLTNELKLSLKFTIYKVSKTSIQPKYKHILNNIDSKTKIVYFTSPNFLTGQSLKDEEFKEFLEKLPDNIIVVIDQTMIDFCEQPLNESIFDPLKHLHENIIVIRSFSNFYGYENLELTYTITSKDKAKLLDESNIVTNQLDTFNEKIAQECLNDTKNNNKVRQKIKKEKNRIYKKLEDNDIDYFPSEVNYILLRPKKDKEELVKLFKKEKMVLEDSDLHYNDYWSLPISTKENNDKILDILTSNF